MRAADADRDGVVERLNIAYSEGRLSKDEHDGRLENALSARTYAELDQLVTDLPAARADRGDVGGQVQRARASELRLRARTVHLRAPGGHPGDRVRPCGPARDQADREQGAGLALAGLIIGWVTVILAIVHRRRPGHVRRDARHRAHPLSIRACGAVAALTWKILTKLRCCPWRAGQLAKAIHVLQVREA